MNKLLALIGLALLLSMNQVTFAADEEANTTEATQEAAPPEETTESPVATEAPADSSAEEPAK